MRKFLIGLLLALSALPAFAQTTTPSPLPPCWPGALGKGEDFLSGKVAAGRYWAWRCPTDDGFRWRDYVAVLGDTYVTKTVPKVVGETDVKYAERMWVANSNTNCSDPAVSSICTAGFDAIKAVPSREPPKFVVAKNGTNTVRPVYSIDDAGVIGSSVAGVKATVGNECACWIRGVRKGTSAYCVFVTTGQGVLLRNQVTLCSAVK